MVTKKQLAALAYGRSVRKANIKNKCKSTKKKTKGTFDDILNELEKNGSDSAKIEVDGKKVEIHFVDSKRREEQKRNERWAKIGKITIGTATLAALTALGYHALKKNDITSWESLKKKLFDKGITQEEMGPVANGAISDNDDLKDKVAQEIYEEIKKETELLPTPPKKPGIFKRIKNATSDAFDKANEVFNDLLKKMTKQPEGFGPENNFKFTYTPPPKPKYEPEVYTFKDNDKYASTLYELMNLKATPGQGEKPLDPNKPSAMKVYGLKKNPIRNRKPLHDQYFTMMQKRMDRLNDLANGNFDERKRMVELEDMNEYISRTNIGSKAYHYYKNKLTFPFRNWLGKAKLNTKKFNTTMKRFSKVIEEFEENYCDLDLNECEDLLDTMYNNVKDRVGSWHTDFYEYYNQLKNIKKDYIDELDSMTIKEKFDEFCNKKLYCMRQLLKTYYNVILKYPTKR